MSQNIETVKSDPSRRDLLKQAAQVAAVATVAGCAGSNAVESAPQKVITRGRIKQSMAYWCFNAAGEKWDIQKQCQVAVMLGCPSIELVDPKDYPILKQHGLVSALAFGGMPDPPFVKGLNNPKHQDEVVARTKEAIDTTAAAGFPNVIAFHGYKWRDAEDPKSGEIPLEEGAKNCVAGLKKLAPYAEKMGVNVCIEMLSTRDNSHPMKGHPGYQGDHMDYVADIVKQVASPRVKLLFDIYHVQVMDGDVIRRIRQYGALIGHVHVAGCPGRAELDDTQEVNYPACMKALLEVGYTGYVGHEFIPTRDPLQGLIQAMTRCDV
jgi:hydroxypyruvate isomerase